MISYLDSINYFRERRVIMYAYQLFPDGEWYCVARGTLNECIAKCERIKKREPNAVFELDDQAPRGRSI